MIMFYNKDTVECLYHFDDNNEFTHSSRMTIRKHMGLPIKSTLLPVPQFNPESERCYFVKNKWEKTELFIGRVFWTEYAEQHQVHSREQRMPEIYSLTPPPEKKDGLIVRLCDGVWQEVEDYRGKVAYAKDRNNVNLDDFVVEQIGAIPCTHTLEPYGRFDSWIEGSGWEYDIERHREARALEERAWRDMEMQRVINRIDQYEKDRNYPPELRTSPIENEEQFRQLLVDRKQLSDYPDNADFPFGERPQLTAS